jgi:hypothetical protein
LSARLPEVEHTHAVAYFPRAAASITHLHDDSSRLVRRNYGKLGLELAVINLEIRVTEACRMDLDEELIVFDLGCPRGN